MQQLQLRGAPLDLRIHETHDVLKPEGLIVLLHAVLRLRHEGLFWAAPPCRSWVWVSTYGTGRHNDVRGNWQTSEAALAANALVERMALVLQLLRVASPTVRWIIENPERTKIYEYPAMKMVVDEAPVLTVRTELGAFGAESVKPVLLKGAAPWLGQLEERCSAEVREHLRVSGQKTTMVYIDGAGEKRCQGTKALSQSQEYPMGFGIRVAQCHRKHLKDSAPIPQGPHGAPVAAGGPPTVDWGHGPVAQLFSGLPLDYQHELLDAWFLADFNGRVWHNAYAIEKAVESTEPRPMKRRRKA